MLCYNTIFFLSEKYWATYPLLLVKLYSSADQVTCLGLDWNLGYLVSKYRMWYKKRSVWEKTQMMEIQSCTSSSLSMLLVFFHLALLKHKAVYGKTYKLLKYVKMGMFLGLENNSSLYAGWNDLVERKRWWTQRAWRATGATCMTEWVVSLQELLWDRSLLSRPSRQ